MTQQYALHVGIPADTTAKHLAKALAATPAPGSAVAYADGDSFLEWGERADTGEARHGLIVFAADDEQAAWHVAVDVYQSLDGLGALYTDANCNPHPEQAPARFALTSAHIWSAHVDCHDGYVTRDANAADWAEHDAHNAAAA